MTLEARDAMWIIVLAVVEVILAEVMIRLGIVGVERAAGLLFVLIVLNGAFVVGFRRILRR